MINIPTNRLVDISMKQNKHDKILWVAAKLIKEKGFKGTSLQKIADGVGLHKSTLFHYFKNKEGLLLEILAKSIGEGNANLERIANHNGLEPEEKLKRAIHNHLTLSMKHFDNVNIYLNELRSLSNKTRAIHLEKRKKYEKNFVKIVRELKQKGYFHGLDLKIVGFGLLGILNWVPKWYKSGGPLTIDEISDIYYRMILKR